MKWLLTILAIILFFGLEAQEILSGLQYNESVRHRAEQDLSESSALKAGIQSATVSLPFFDDFSRYSLYPDEKLWIGKSVFVNKDFPLYPPNNGAATFDAIDATGRIYTNANWIPFMADELKSRPIRTDSVFDPVLREIGPEDSLYLSFYYQPQGVGDDPESWDTLILEFSRMGDTIFSHIDSVLVSAQIYLDSPDDTIRPLDTIWAPGGEGCDTNIYMINFRVLGWDDWLWVPCDSVFGPDTLWDKVWQAEGMQLEDFKAKYGSEFDQVMVPLYREPADSVYFFNGFQFRFRNYASISDDIIPSWRSNTDHWNIDWVYLDINRNAGDTTYRALTFSQRAPSFLKDYQVIPYRQYRAGSVTDLLKPRFEMYIANLDNQERNTNYEYRVQQVNGDFYYGYYGGSCNLPPFDLFGFQNCNSSCGTAHACPPVNSAFNYDFSRDTTSYIITHYISDSSEAEILVDSISYRQGFYNYYAYDDGTPEFGYGIEPAGARMAYQFELSIADTLQGVQMYFNRTQNNSNELFFNLVVWQDNNGRPGVELYRSPSIKPQWKEGLYEFYPYMLDEPIFLNGTFYVGWQQQSGGNLNIGLDANNDNGNRIFFTEQTEWLNSNVSGSLMIRPIVGSNLVLGDNEINQSPPEKLSVFPNPAKDILRIDMTGHSFSQATEVYLYNIYGIEVLHQPLHSNPIDIRFLPQGMYIVKVNDRGRVMTAKLLISK